MEENWGAGHKVVLDTKDGNVTLVTLQRAAELLGRKVRLELV